jgi:hypothetical protein
MIPDFKKRSALCALSLLYLLSLPAYAQEAPSTRNPSQLSRLQSRLQELSDAFPGVIGVAVRDLKTGEEISINDAGIMFVRGNPIAIAVFTVDKRTSRGEVEERMGRLTRVVYDFFDAIK